MPERRKKRGSPPARGLPAGQRLLRDRLAGADHNWAWVATEVQDESEITQEHLLQTCGLSQKSHKSFCPNKFTPKSKPKSQNVVEGELEDDSIIVISDTEDTTNCSKRACSDNPNCLNYLGQELWEKEDDALEAFLKVVGLGENPAEYKRDPKIPIGLKNLGATCYANAFLQVWFQDLAFRAGVYQCQPPRDSNHKYEDSPIFQLQVTFAALQVGIENVFNPIKLVESLMLRTSEQQDAQEFSKLFMSHLDSEFKKQTLPRLKSLIPDQFEGKLLYATVCENCKNRSERESQFLELELNLQNNSTVEDRLSALLAPEKLTDDNKYLCSYCESLEDATRYTEIHNLPPVLHISLLRFVYDVSTMARKKSKQVIQFPPYLNMEQFLHVPKTAPGSSMPLLPESEPIRGKHVYELRGVLLHKGPSAYHGHYEARVYDVTAKQWYQFNDDEVSPLSNLHKPSGTKVEKANANDASVNGRAKQTKKAGKRRIDDSDDDVDRIEEIVPEPRVTKYLTSKDAYMLIYARCDPDGGTQTKNPASTMQTNGIVDLVVTTGISAAACTAVRSAVPNPPERALEVVRSLNNACEEECRKYDEREKEHRQKFKTTRQMVLDIYRSWSVSSAQDEFVVLSRSALENWLKSWLTTTKRKTKETEADQSTKKDSTPATEEDFPDSSSLLASTRMPSTSLTDHNGSGSENVIDNSSIFCRHGLLDPLKGPEMKRIRTASFEAIMKCSERCFDPNSHHVEVCRQCVQDEFNERLYQIEHPRMVDKFDEIHYTETESEGYWISKAWLKDWRCPKPKMHVRSRGDPPPDDEEYARHVQCEHGGLSLNLSVRRRISEKAVALLQKIYPNWNPPPWSEESCAVCDALVIISKEDKLELRKKAENEKALLKRVSEIEIPNLLSSQNQTGVVVSAKFVRSWKAWLQRPGDAARPESLDNSVFFCEHQKLNLDPNNAADLRNILVISFAEWETLNTFYTAGPLIEIRTVHDLNGFGKTRELSVTTPDICADCCRKRRLQYETTRITVMRLKEAEKIPEHASSSSIVDEVLMILNGKNHDTIKSGSGIRQSKRLREKNTGSTITVKKTTTIREIKVLLQKELDVPTISQRLFYHGRELEGNTTTVADAEILANDVLYLKAIEEDDELLLTSDNDELRSRKKRNEGRAFGGTLLGGGTADPSPMEVDVAVDDTASETPSEHPTVTMRTCTTCTFENLPGALNCEMCDFSL
ncbi:cysteine proteinase [Rickenella mellea]|uniref:ubiquitinyl hydrolase 1 n=1 Tax=Rickenella mellea TaxID=50990 RepID=A0A4Y7Q366_9AGAM|nr:cysteine proteinase [Rickenella mellea]